MAVDLYDSSVRLWIGEGLIPRGGICIQSGAVLVRRRCKNDQAGKLAETKRDDLRGRRHYSLLRFP